VVISLYISLILCIVTDALLCKRSPQRVSGYSVFLVYNSRQTKPWDGGERDEIDVIYIISGS